MEEQVSEIEILRQQLDQKTRHCEDWKLMCQKQTLGFQRMAIIFQCVALVAMVVALWFGFHK